jgi:hypothetical protein
VISVAILGSSAGTMTAAIMDAADTLEALYMKL